MNDMQNPPWADSPAFGRFRQRGPLEQSTRASAGLHCRGAVRYETVADFVAAKERIMGNDQQPGEEEPVEGGVAAFDFDGTGVRIDAENSPVPSAGEELKAAFVQHRHSRGGRLT